MADPTAPSMFAGVSSGGSLNNKDFYRFGMLLKGLTGAGMPPVKSRSAPRAGAHGSHRWTEYYDSRPLVLTGRMVADSALALQANIDAAKVFLGTFRRPTPRRLRFIDPVQPDRFWRCHYGGSASFVEIGARERACMADFAISLIADPPFSEATALTEETYAAPAGTFRTVETGTFESEMRLILKGPATNPKVIFGDSIFICPFDLSTDYTDIEGATQAGTFSGTPAQKAALFSPSNIGLGYSLLASGAYQLSWPVIGNANAATWAVIVEPQFDFLDAGGGTVFQHRYDATNYIILVYFRGDAFPQLDRRWVFQKVTAGGGAYVVSPEQNFAAGDVIRLGVSHGASGMQMFIDGDLVAANLDTAPLAANPTSLTLHSYGSDFSANSKVHFLAGWSSELTENEHALVASDPDENVTNRNQVLQWTGALAAGDWLAFDNRDGRYEGKKLTMATGALAEGIFPDDGYLIPVLQAENTSIYHPAAVADVHLQFPKRYL